MKKILFAMTVLLGCTTMSFAQTSFIATLQHEGEFSHFYGGGALSSAYNAAVDGDIITLSPGTFSSPGTFDKGVTLRGAGVESPEQTYISGSITFCSTISTRVTTVEGIRFSGTVNISNNSSGNGQGSLKFIKNVIQSVQAITASSYSTNKGPSVRFYNNALYGLYFSSNTHPDFLLYNCYIENPQCSGIYFSETTTTFVNCIIRWSETSYSGGSNSSYARLCYYLNFYNCIFNRTPNGSNNPNRTSLPITATAYNCLSINDGYLFNGIVSGGNNQTVNSASDVFVSYRDSHITGELFELTETAKKTYIGTDGTQIGMQGGNYPYNTIVQYPVITKFHSEPQTTKEGILTIDVEVDGK